MDAEAKTVGSEWQEFCCESEKVKVRLACFISKTGIRLQDFIAVSYIYVIPPLLNTYRPVQPSKHILAQKKKWQLDIFLKLFSLSINMDYTF